MFIVILPLLMLGLAACNPPALALGPCQCVEGDIDGDGAKEIVLENQFLKVTVEPSSGGRLARVEYKPVGVDLTSYGPFRGEQPGGLFGDRIIGQSYPGDFLETTAAVTILENTADKVRVRLTSRGSSGSAESLHVEKELSLERERSSLEVAGSLSLRTGRTDVGSVKTGLWWQHILRIGEMGTQTGFRNTYFVPLTTGILALPFIPQARNEFKTNDGFMHNPARGWIGCVSFGKPGDKSAPAGAVFTLDYSRLQHYYICMSPSMLDYPTLEWYYQPTKFQDGDSFRTRVMLTPFRGMEEITGAEQGIVGQLSLGATPPKVGEETSVSATLMSDRTRKVTVELTDHLLTWTTGEGKVEAVASQPASLVIDEPMTVALSLRIRKPGTHVIGVRVLGSEGQLLPTFEKPLVVDKPSGNYVLHPTVPRVVVDPKVEQRDNLSGPPTPHVPWAKPLRNGPVRALVLTNLPTARHVVEIGQRLDMQCDDVLNDGRSLVEKETCVLWGQRGSATRQHFDVEEHESEVERLRRLVTQNRYDVMVVDPDALLLSNVPADVRDLIVKRVQEGMGLVCLGPSPHKAGEGWLDAVTNVSVRPGSAIPHHIHLIDSEENYQRDGIVRTANRSLMNASDFAALVPGTWRVRVMDFLSGKEATAQWEIRPRGKSARKLQSLAGVCFTNQRRRKQA